MGCTASKLDNEDAVRRCKDRRRHMKDAVFARHHLAAAHSDYIRSLRITGSALSAFAAGEPLSVSAHTPAVLLRSTTTAKTTPTPPPHFSPSPPSPTIASSKLPHIQGWSQRGPVGAVASVTKKKKSTILYREKTKFPMNYIGSPLRSEIHSSVPAHILSASSNVNISRRHHHHRKQPVKLPHILSESNSTPSSSPKSHDFAPSYTRNFNPTYSTTATSRTSSVWNWENYIPPSPPDSEFFEQRKNREENAHLTDSNYENPFHNHHHNPRTYDGDDDKTSTYSNYRNHHLRPVWQRHIGVGYRICPDIEIRLFKIRRLFGILVPDIILPGYSYLFAGALFLGTPHGVYLISSLQSTKLPQGPTTSAFYARERERERCSLPLLQCTTCPTPH